MLAIGDIGVLTRRVSRMSNLDTWLLLGILRRLVRLLWMIIVAGGNTSGALIYLLG